MTIKPCVCVTTGTAALRPAPDTRFPALPAFPDHLLISAYSMSARPRVRTLTIFFALSVLVFSGCSGSRGAAGIATPEEAFQRAEALKARGRYERATEFYQRVFEFGRTSELAADAQFALAEAYDLSRQYLLAVSEFSRFVELYRADPRVPEAEFRRAVSSMRMAPNHELDQTDTQRAITFFQLFITRFPNHEYRPQAEQHMVTLRGRLARKSFESARLYERRGLFEAAAMTYVVTFEQYPDTDLADDAVLGAQRSYLRFAQQSVVERQRERMELSLSFHQRMLDLFPESPLRRDSDALARETQALMGTPSAS